ncbi:glycosyl hydrolase family 5 [Leptolyngbyaceae cyanobacterium CCMR0082]|uniref:Endoglucanase n=1 Tax=Adonisia turfae CCMR0082 TaxID=2304604 RepID=A0A6M0S8F2_9CYAN|nr:glycoside hydrolase family 9 protein [Adonisia turfae]NEZ64689.1 glycosyl hydrolase family 5 [Adonisia turfae CCMR0082]
MKRTFRLLLSLAIAVFLATCIPQFKGHTQAPDSSVKVLLNQVGYYPQWLKVAFISSPLKGTPIQLINLDNQQVVELDLSEPVQSERLSGDVLQPVDFSHIQQPGKYIVRAGSAESAPFSISDNAYQTTLISLLRSYYLQRCGVILDDPITGLYHAPCHLHDHNLAHADTLHQVNDKINATGGWHDAGDYGKYVATTATTVARILSLYEQHPSLFWDGQLTIPESGNGIPDVLDEMKFGLDWMLRMQRSDGAVYRKLSGSEWPIGMAPDEDAQTRYIYGISTPETGKLAGAMAMAARVFESFDVNLADQYQASADLAWQYLEGQPTMQVDWYEGDDSGSGKYLASDIDREESLKTDLDDRFWAAVELYISTGNKKYQQYLETHLLEITYTLFEWKDLSPLALVDYRLQKRQPSSSELNAIIDQKLLTKADEILTRVENNGYRLANHRFIWGSNKLAAEEGITLAYAYQISQEQRYQYAALDQLHFLLGRNPFNQTFVTGVGANPVRHVNHLFARAKGLLIPGLVVGGPNSDAQDNIAPKGLGILSYLDDEKSYATNEYAIDYNASLIGLIGLLISGNA